MVDVAFAFVNKEDDDAGVVVDWDSKPIPKNSSVPDLDDVMPESVDEFVLRIWLYSFWPRRMAIIGFSLL